jgi:hypothetical protein
LTPIASFKQPEKARILLKVIKENPRSFFELRRIDTKIREHHSICDHQRLKMKRAAANIPIMSLAEIEKAVDELSPEELTKLAAHIARRDKLTWNDELEADFSAGGKHEKTLKKIDAEIDSGNFTPIP